MTRRSRIAALLLLPAAVLAGCSHSGGDAGSAATASAEPSASGETSATAAADATRTPKPTTVPDIVASPAPSSATSNQAAVEDGDLSADQRAPQGLDQPAALDDGLALQIGQIRSEDLTPGPGEVGGPTIIVPVTVGNPTDKDLSLDGLVVNVSYGADGAPAEALDSASDTPPETLSPGQAFVVEYAFVVPIDQRDSVSITVDSGAESTAAVFQGAVPTS